MLSERRLHRVLSYYFDPVDRVTGARARVGARRARRDLGHKTLLKPVETLPSEYQRAVRLALYRFIN